MDFYKAYKLVGLAEGGYSNDPDDVGGETIFGISRNKNGNLSIWNDIDIWKKRGLSGSEIIKLTKADGYFMDRVQAFYRGGFWNKCKCDELPELERYPIFSCAVNCSPAAAIIFLQRALKVKDDGIIGKQTIATARLAKVRPILDSFYNQWSDYYDRIVKRNPSQAKFINGWKNRIENVKKENETI